MATTNQSLVKKKLADFESLTNNPYQEKLKPLFKIGWRRIDPEKAKQVVDTDSGEVLFISEVGNVKLLLNDNSEFTKLFAAANTEIPKLNTQGLKMLTHIFTLIKKDVDWIKIDMPCALKWCGFSSRTQLYNGIISLLDNKFICRKTGGANEYYINVNFFFNGKRTNLEFGHNLKSRLVDEARKGRLNIKKITESNEETAE